VIRKKLKRIWANEGDLMARFTEELSACENKRALEAHMERKRHFCDIKKIKPQVASRPALDLDFCCVVSLLYKPGFLQFSSAFVSFVML
jgi:hypothetical protein